ncbi:hypothetical protein B0H66DRAFT_377855 [Apodospora peruviana]|uniref:Uncharacterized protein n=1 Tax=Apodospora peruviana TaxID=516989 RepID=A0AAE0HTH8_9PEZI|nr:hypothetical protein B0H66DRAFT_377855 [Apodospora peruviana]
MLRLCPNLEQLEATDLWGSHELFYLPSISLVKLDYLEVWPGEDPEWGIQNIFINNLKTIFQVVPNLTRLRLFEPGVCHDMGLTLSHVTSLDLSSSCMDEESMDNLLRACSRLERLRLSDHEHSGRYGSTFTPMEAAHSVLEHTPSLKNFHLDISNCEFKESRFEGPEGAFTLWEEFESPRRKLTARGIEFTYDSIILHEYFELYSDTGDQYSDTVV